MKKKKTEEQLKIEISDLLKERKRLNSKIYRARQAIDDARQRYLFPEIDDSEI